MLISKSAPTVPLTDTQDAKNTTAAGPIINSDGADDPPWIPLALLIVMTFHIISGRIGGQVVEIKNSLQQKKDDLDSCTALLNGLSSWNTPPLDPTIPPNPLDPVNQDRVDKTDALYLNGISIPDSDYDGVKYTYGDPPKTGYSSFPITGGLDPSVNNHWVVGEIYDFPTPGKSNYFVYRGEEFSTKFVSPGSPLPLNKQNGTDFSNSTPGDLVQDLDTGKYYRISNAKTGIEVSGYPLQKFVQSPDSNVIASLNAQISQRINTVSDLTQTVSLELQKYNGLYETAVQTCSQCQASETAARNNFAKFS